MIRLFSQKEDFASEDGLITPKNKTLFWAFGLVAGSWLICIFISTVLWFLGTKATKSTIPQAEAFTQFASETEFRTFVTKGQEQSSFSGDIMVGGGRAALMKSSAEMMPAELPLSAGLGTTPERVSETNVQVAGIDEPDIVKTDGKSLYLSGEKQYYTVQPMMRMMPNPDIAPLPQPTAATQIVQALPVDEIKKLGKIEKQGDLLLVGTKLLVFDNQTITGFDVREPNAPKEIWSLTLADNRQITSARLVDNKVIFVSEMNIYAASPCPLPLFKGVSETSVIQCTDIWRPQTPILSDTTYSILSLNPETGVIENQVSFVGSTGQTVVYVSPTAVYVSFTKTKDWGALTAEFLTAESNTLVTAENKDRLKKVLALDISQMAKQVEVDQILNQYAMGMSDDERLQWETERTNQLSKYVDERKRALETTSIAKVLLSNFTITAIGEVPGHPLNQFSLDEYQGNFRIATTVGGRGLGGGVTSGNDVYILNQDMKTVGSVTDLGREERIYAVRFMGNRGYVVTFKETDPLYVLDLSNAAAPVVTGELKIPGYSSYLHPLKDGLIVGIGKEDSQVKLSLFDVRDPSNPVEVDNFLLSDYWSEILTTHRAFLQDADHNLFFMPGDKGGYIFGYEGNKLNLLKTVEGYGIKRALYINDNLYLIAANKLTVISETDWKIVKTLEW